MTTLKETFGVDETDSFITLVSKLGIKTLYPEGDHEFNVADLTLLKVLMTTIFMGIDSISDEAYEELNEGMEEAYQKIMVKMGLRE